MALDQVWRVTPPWTPSPGSEYYWNQADAVARALSLHAADPVIVDRPEGARVR